jgi:hypothetical protein
MDHMLQGERADGEIETGDPQGQRRDQDPGQQSEHGADNDGRQQAQPPLRRQNAGRESADGEKCGGPKRGQAGRARQDRQRHRRQRHQPAADREMQRIVTQKKRKRRKNSEHKDGE